MSLFIDCNIGGAVDGTAGGDADVVDEQAAEAEALGFDGLWSTEVGRDPFLPLVLAARRARTIRVGTGVAIAFARSPMTVASTAYDLQGFSEGRFVLGLGSQVKAHVTRRYGMPWSDPADRMREYVRALRAIWESWATESALDFRGEHYQHTLMTPMFRPTPHEWNAPPVYVAAVGPRMVSAATAEADGVVLHSFSTVRGLRERTLPDIESGLAGSGRQRRQFTVCLPALVASGGNDREVELAAERVRSQLAFYGATPAYRSALARHGWEDLHTELHRLSTAGRWHAMTALVDDDVMDAFAVVGTPRHVGREIRRRYSGVVDRVTLSSPVPLSAAVRAEVLAAARDRPRLSVVGGEEPASDEA